MGKPSLDEVLAMYARGEITACTAADMLGIPLAKFYELWAESGMTLGPEWAKDLMEELKRLSLKKPFASPTCDWRAYHNCERPRGQGGFIEDIRR